MSHMVVEVTGSSGNYIDSIVVDDEDDINRYLSGFVGTSTEHPALLEWLDEEGDVFDRMLVLYGLRDGVPYAWRTAYKD